MTTALLPVDMLAPTVRVYDALRARLDDMGFPKVKRSYVTVGEVDFPTRCPQFVVAARQLYPGKPNQPTPGLISPHDNYYELSLEIGVAYTRPWPISENVLESKVEDRFGREVLSEGQMVFSAINAAYQAKELSDSCSDAGIGSAVFVGPEGGVAGITVLLAVQLR